MNALDAIQSIRAKSLFGLYGDDVTAHWAACAEVISYGDGEAIPQSPVPDCWFVVVQGQVALLAPEDHSIQKGVVGRGRSVELKTLFSKEAQWRYDWKAKGSTTVIKIPKDQFFQQLNTDTITADYLRKMTLNPELQRIRNDITLCGLKGADLRRTVSLFGAVRDPEDANSKEAHLMVVRTGGATLRKHISPEETQVVAHYVAGDYLVFDGTDKGHHLQLDVNSSLWALSLSDWAQVVATEHIDNFIHFISPDGDYVDAGTQTTQSPVVAESSFTKAGVGEEPSQPPAKKLSVKDFVADPDELKKIHKKKYHTVVQHDEMDCGAACMATIAKFHGRRISLPHYRSIIHVTREGASMLSVKQAAAKTGIDGLGVMCGLKGLKKLRPPFIALMEYHFIVVYEVGDKEVVCSDPARGLVKVPTEQFMEEYSKSCLLLKPNEGFYEYPESSYSFSKYLSLLKGTGPLLLETFFASLLVFLLGLGLPLFLQVVFDQFLGGGNSTLINLLAIGVLALNIISGITNYVRTYLMSHLSAVLDAKLSSLFMRHVFRLPLNFFAVRRVGDLTTRLQEMSKIREIATGQTLSLLMDLVSILVYGAVVWLYSGLLFAVVVAVALANIGFIGFLMPKITTHLKDEYKALGKSQSAVFETFKNLKTIKSVSGALAARWRWNTAYSDTIQLERKSGFLFLLLGVGNQLFVEIGKAIILFISVFLYFDQQLSLGQVIAVHTIAASIMGPLMSLLQQWESLSDAGVSLGRVDDVVTSATEPDPGEGLRFEAELMCSSGILKGQEFLIGDAPIALGRDSSCDVDLSKETGVSGLHAKIYRQGTHYFVEDQNSSNGTLVNNNLVKRTKLKHGDTIQLAGAKFSFFKLGVTGLREKTTGGDLEGDVFFDNVFFQYGSELSPIVLNGVSLQIKKGETVAVVGRSGCGKTTLAYMLNLLYAPTKGDIYIDGVNTKEIPLKKLRDSIAMIVQENHIFSGTIFENISLGDPHPSFDRVIEAAKGADAHDFIIKQPDGYLAKLAESGEGLSGGQKQRLNIARAFYKRPQILIMDEATSALDAISEQNVMNHMRTFTAGMTTMVIAHRFNTIMHADRIVVLDEGMVVESGTHQELVAQGGQYYDMFRKQVQF